MNKKSTAKGTISSLPPKVMAKPYSKMDTGKLELTIKMNKKSTAKGTISSLPHKVMAKPYSKMDTEKLEDVIKMDKKSSAKGTQNRGGSFTISSLPYQFDPCQTKRITTRSSRQELKMVEHNDKKIDLSSQDLKCIPNYVSYNCEVEELDLSNNPRLGEGTDWSWFNPALEKLNLSGCDLITLPCCLRYFRKLKELNLSNNPLKQSDYPDLLKKLGRYHRPGLKVIFDDIVYIKNSLEDFEPSWYSWSVYPERAPSLTTLTKINITGDGSRICGDHLEGSKEELEMVEHNNKKLDLSSQDLKCIPDYLFSNSEVEELDLSHNPRLGEEKNLVFPELKYLRKLNLSYCNFEKVPNELLKYQLLGELNFSYNSPQVLFELPPLRNLWKLDLSGCDLTVFSAYSFRYMSVRELNLSNNPLKHSARFHWCYRELEKLDLSGCSLITLPDGLGNCRKLKEMNLSNNPLKHSDYPDLLEKLGGYHFPGLKVIFDDAVYIKNNDEVASHVRRPTFLLKIYRWRRISKIEWIDSGVIREGEIDDKTPIADVTTYSVPVVLTGGQNPDNSIAVDEKGGCFRIPAASAFLVFPPQAVEEQVTLMCSRVSYKECEVKPRDEEMFVGRILKIEPEGMKFKNPVTVLLSHSVYIDQDFLDFYELVVEILNPAGCEELKTERISCVEDIPKEILNREILSDYLPFAKATISETCTLVAATRFKSDQITVPTNKNYSFSKKYGDNKRLEITFPAGVAEKEQCLTIQLLPPDVVLNQKVYLNDNLVCVPVIKVSGQTNRFLKPVHVSLTYSHDDVANIDEDFLPVGKRIEFASNYGSLLRSSHKDIKSKSRWLALNETNVVYINRVGKDKIVFSFSVDHFCKITPVVKKNASTQFPNIEENSTVIQCLKPQPKFLAFLFAVHCRKTSTLYAVLAPQLALPDLNHKWEVTGIRYGPRLKCTEGIYVCVPLENDTTHLSLKDCILWFDPEYEFELPNKTSEDVHLEGEYMYFLVKECTDKNHDFKKDGRAKVSIHESNKENIPPLNDEKPSPSIIDKKPSPSIELGQGNNDPPSQEVADYDQVTPPNKVLRKNISRLENFEEKIESEFLERLKMNKNDTKNPDVGEITKKLSGAGKVTSLFLGLGAGVLLSLSIGSFGVPAIVGAAVTGLTFTVEEVDKKMKKRKAKELDEKLEVYFHCHLKCIIKDVAKELSRIYEYQLLTLKDDIQAEILAKCAVKLMLDLKKGEKFDRNTLLRKVLQDGSMKKKKLLTINDNKWSVPDVFRKPGLRRSRLGTNHAEFKYFVKPGQACDTQTYGYRGQFLEMKKYGDQIEEEEKVQVLKYRKRVSDENIHPCEDLKLCQECSSYHENCTSGQYFVESSIDSEYSDPHEELRKDHPIHVLVQCPKVLDSFVGSRQAEKLSLANFLKNKLGLPEDHIVLPVYRQHSPGKGPDLKNSVLTGSDFSHSDFTNSSLEECDFTKCVMLFAELAGAKMSGSKFVDTLISHSNLVGVKADHCEWTKTSLLFSCMDGADLGSVEPSICGNCLDGTNIDSAITGKNRMVKVNGTPVKI